MHSMLKCRFYTGNQEISINKTEGDIEQILKHLDALRVKPGDVVVCKSAHHYGTLCSLVANERYGSVPLFLKQDLSIHKDSWLDKLLNELINIKAVVESDERYGFDVISSPFFREGFNKYEIKPGSILFLTSATTGNPKVIMRTKEQLEKEITRYIRRVEVSDTDVFLPGIPIDNSFGIGSVLFPVIRTGAVLVDPLHMLPRIILQLSAELNATIISGAPFIFKKMIEVQSKYVLGEKIRFCISTGGPMEAELQKAFKERFGAPLLQQYGSTETGSLAFGEENDSYSVVGKPLDGVGFNIVNDELDRPILYISSPGTIGAYITENGIEELPKTNYRTGDMGRMTQDGKLEILGRSDDVIIVTGVKVSKSLLSSIITKFPGITHVKIGVLENRNLPEIYCEYAGSTDIDAGKLLEFCKKNIPGNQVPKFFRHVHKSELEPRSSWKTDGGS